jgi:flagellar basal body-associated protein FliL
MKPNKVRMRGRGISSVFTAIIMALVIAAVIAAIAISWPMIKSTFDKNYWSGSMGLYNLRFKNSTYAYAQNGVGGSLSSKPSPIGYCIAYGDNSTNTTYTCPSNTPSYQP